MVGVEWRPVKLFFQWHIISFSVCNSIWFVNIKNVVDCLIFEAESLSCLLWVTCWFLFAYFWPSLFVGTFVRSIMDKSNCVIFSFFAFTNSFNAIIFHHDIFFWICSSPHVPFWVGNVFYQIVIWCFNPGI